MRAPVSVPHKSVIRPQSPLRLSLRQFVARFCRPLSSCFMFSAMVRGAGGQCGLPRCGSDAPKDCKRIIMMAGFERKKMIAPIVELIVARAETTTERHGTGAGAMASPSRGHG
ncbi:hypothetical protein CBOM_00029 [Ceraceosorus bombacis]|uniref:Uncharacterized protein n=1 Tax=Ceraceosorus bombacis TaxID=401625 RepID=A0A0P1B9P9_9BASI|nr:hypothetical protein CBOM_00029 [Ceraceosorus bombacis]